MGKASQRKGYRVEHLLEKQFQNYGINARRIPLSGATSFMKGDIHIDLWGVQLIAEVKARKNGFARFYKKAVKDYMYVFWDDDEEFFLTTFIGFVDTVKGKPVITTETSLKLFPQLRKWLTKADLVFLKANYKDFLVVMPAKTFYKIVEIVNKRRVQDAL